MTMHICTLPREETLTVKFQGKVFEVRLGSDGAYVPSDLGMHMVSRGLVAKDNMPDPPPQWVMNSDGSLWRSDSKISALCSGSAAVC
jgi:hypothetical protein